tara:strand:+ start:2113 stop:3660 length:1548 start_codon:yes stop_codon:yes gene_type:complete
MDLVLISGIIGGMVYLSGKRKALSISAVGNLKCLLKNVPLLSKSRKTIIAIDREEEFKDMSRELKGIATDIVVNDFFNSDASLYNFLDLVYNTFEQCIEKYVKLNNLKKTDLFFTFKGGNILRIVYKELISELPARVSNSLEEFYKKFFKRSDADFSIYINPELENYDTIYDEWCILSYHIQDHIRSTIESDMTDYFDYFKYADTYADKIMAGYLNEFKGANSLSDVDNEMYNGTDFLELIFTNKSKYNGLVDFITEDGAQGNELVRHDLKNSKSCMYISLNKTLEFTSGDGGITKFALVRTKVNFNLLWKTKKGTTQINVGGELIDVSIPHRKDKSINHVFDNLKEAISRYTVSESGKSIQFNSYSLKFLIEDLEKILFHVAEFPWDDNKYVKRLNRLCYTYFIEMFIKQKYNKNRKKQLEKVLKALSGKRTKVAGTSPKDSVSELDRMLWYYNLIVDRANGKYAKQLNEFKANIVINLKELLVGFKNIDSYCNKGDAVVKEDEIYTSTAKTLV